MTDARPEALTLQELSDRAAIGELLARYAHAVDDGDWDLLDTVFTADAEIDLSAPGGPRSTRAEVKAWLAATLTTWPGRQHLLGLASISLAGDRATARATFTDTLSPSRDIIDDGTPGFIRGGGSYHHDLVRTPEGWRSHRMTIEQQWRTMRSR
jgi:hypothetical protein